MLFHNVVAPVKNPPVATNTTKPRSTPAFLSFISLSFLVQILIYCRHRVVCGAPKVICGTPKIICGAPQVICGSPSVICGAPPVTFGVPKVVCGTPKIICGVPQMTRWSPPVTQRRHYLPFLAVLLDNLRILLNKYSLFNTQNLQSWLIS